MSSSLTRYLLLILKLSVSSTLFYLLISKVGGRTIMNNLRMLDPAAFIAAVGIYLTAASISSLRWGLLIPQPVGKIKLFSMFMIGSFFNAYMPGIVGGDAVKAYYLSRQLKHSDSANGFQPEGAGHNAIAIASVFMDRYIGLSALLCIGTIALPFGMGYLEGASLKWPIKWIIPLVAVFYVSATIMLFRFRLGSRFKFLFSAYEYLNFYASRKYTLLKAFLYSLLVQMTGIISVYVLSQGLSLNIPFMSVLIFLPIIVLFSVLPVTISGIGLREGAFVFLFGTIGVPADMAMSLSIVWFLSVVTAGLLGLFYYLRFKDTFGGKIE